jgi:sec-independent protein translocase protein TatA
MIIEIARRRKPRAEDTTMGDLLQPTHLLIIAILLFVLFGAKRLPELGKGLGEGLKGFKEGLKGVTDPTPPTPPAPTVQQNVTPAPPPSAPDDSQIRRL